MPRVAALNKKTRRKQGTLLTRWTKWNREAQFEWVTRHMPRQARLDSPGTLHPVMIRGIEKQRVSQATKWVPAWLAAVGASKDRGRLGREL